MHEINNQYFIFKTITYDFYAEKSSIMIEKPTIELVSIDYCCFHKITSEIGPASILLNVSKIVVQRSSFVKMISHDTDSPKSGTSGKLISNNMSLNYSFATQCETKYHDNFHISGQKQQLSFINNTHNRINHITFAYLYVYTESETSYCQICHNPSVEGVEFQSFTCDLSLIHHCVFAYNSCSRNNPNPNYDVVRMYYKGTMEANDLYFFKNDQMPLSKDGNVTLIAYNIYTDNRNFYSVTPSNVNSVSSLPVYFSEHAAAKCMKETKQGEQQSKFRLSIAVTFWLTKLLLS